MRMIGSYSRDDKARLAYDSNVLNYFVSAYRDIDVA